MKQASGAVKTKIIVVMLACAVITVIALQPQTSRADAIYIYPAKCDGGWYLPHLAAGEPDTVNEDPNLYTDQNSAILEGTSKELYCGDFQGTIPENVVPTAVTVSFNWIMKSAIPPKDAESTLGKEFRNVEQYIEEKVDRLGGDSIPAAEPAPADLPLAEPIPGTEVFEAPALPVEPTAPVQEESTPAPVPAAEEGQPVSYLFKRLLANVALAEDIPVSPTDIASTTNSFNTSLVDIYPNEYASSTPEAAPFLEIRYSVDGEHWTTIGYVNKENFQSVSFPVPADTVHHWDDVSKIQIGIADLPTEKTPIVYLNSVALEVRYGPAPVAYENFLRFLDLEPSERLFLAVRDDETKDDKLVVSTDRDSIGGIAIYNTESAAAPILTTYSDAANYSIDSSYFSEGKFSVINTSDPNLCANLSITDCEAADAFISKASFNVVRPKKSSSASSTDTSL